MEPQAAGAAKLPCFIKVVRCGHPFYWWAPKIGETFFAVLYRPETHDFVLEDGECILAQDVEFC